MADAQELKTRFGPSDQVRVGPKHGLRPIPDLIRDPEDVYAGLECPRHERVSPGVEGQRAHAVALGARAQALPGGAERVVAPRSSPPVYENEIVALISEASVLDTGYFSDTEWYGPLEPPT